MGQIMGDALILAQSESTGYQPPMILFIAGVTIIWLAIITWVIGVVRQAIADRRWDAEMDARAASDNASKSAAPRAYLAGYTGTDKMILADDHTDSVAQWRAAAHQEARQIGRSEADASRLADRYAADRLAELEALHRSSGREWQRRKAAYTARLVAEAEAGIDFQRLDR